MFSPSGEYCRVRRKGRLSVWRIENRRKKELVWSIRENEASYLAVTNEGAVVDNEGWEIFDGSPRKRYVMPDEMDEPFFASFSPSGSFVLFAAINSSDFLCMYLHVFFGCDLIRTETLRTNGPGESLDFRCGFADDATIWFRFCSGDTFFWKFLNNENSTPCMVYSNVRAFVTKSEELDSVLLASIEQVYLPHYFILDKHYSFVFNTQIWDLSEEVGKRTVYRREHANNSSQIVYVHRDCTMAMTKGGKVLDLVGSRRLMDIYLVFSGLPLYVVLLICDWLRVLEFECSIEAAERWHHTKKVDVLLGVQKSMAAARKERERRGQK